MTELTPIALVVAVLVIIVVLIFVLLKVVEKKGSLTAEKEHADDRAEAAEAREDVRAQPIPAGADLIRRMRARAERLRRRLSGDGSGDEG